MTPLRKSKYSSKQTRILYGDDTRYRYDNGMVAFGETEARLNARKNRWINKPDAL